MIRFSRREDYAIILINKLAQNYKKRLVPLSEISKEYTISLLFLRNLALELKNAGIIKAVEGKNGGYYLQQDPKVITVGEVLHVFPQKPLLECCPVGNTKHNTGGSCPKESFCQTGFVWRKIHKEFLDKIYTLTITEFMNYKTL